MDVSQANTSRNDGPTRLAVHALEGWGKTTLATHFPSPLVVGNEKGIPRDLGFSVKTIRPDTWKGQFELAHSLGKDKHDYRTLVYDTLDWIEPQIHRFVLERDSGRETEMNPKGRELISIEDYGYGKGYIVAEEEFRKFIEKLDWLQEQRGIHIVILMHSQVRTFKNPAGPDFDRYEPKCQSRIARVAIEWAENVLFGFFQQSASKEPDDVKRNEKSAKAKGQGMGVRVVGANQSAMYDAKNRVGLPNEFDLPATYDDLLPVLLGENVPANVRRAAIQERPTSTGWADQQREKNSRNARAAASAEVDASLKGTATKPLLDDRDPTDNGRMHSRAELDARNPTRGTEDRGLERSNERTRDEAHARDASPRSAERRSEWTEPKKSDVAASSSPSPDQIARRTRLDEALKFAGEKKGDVYVGHVRAWIEKAAGDPNKIEAIIKRVGADCGMNF